MFNIKVIFTVSDNLTDSAKDKLEKMFGCPVINRYSNEEQGVLAYSPAYSNIFSLNTASYHFELLNLNNNEHAKVGEVGRLVVTDLYNRSMPFIRYDTGDLAISNDEGRDNITHLLSFQGRVADIIKDTQGNIITAPIVNNYIAEFYEIKRYQLIQYDEKSYLLKVICDGFAKDSVEYIKACNKFLGNDADIEIEYVDHIPAEKTGKYKTIVNKCKVKE